MKKVNKKGKDKQEQEGKKDDFSETSKLQETHPKQKHNHPNSHHFFHRANVPSSRTFPSKDAETNKISEGSKQATKKKRKKRKRK
jgi:hypothetical protein